VISETNSGGGVLKTISRELDGGDGCDVANTRAISPANSSDKSDLLIFGHVTDDGPCLDVGCLPCEFRGEGMISNSCTSGGGAEDLGGGLRSVNR